MKLTIIGIDNYVGPGPIYDPAPEIQHFTMEPDQNPGGLYEAKLVAGVRFTVAMVEPDPAFFFSVADIGDGADECVMIHCDLRNTVGAYFKKDRA